MQPQIKRNLATAIIALAIATALVEFSAASAVNAFYPTQYGSATALVVSQSCPSGIAVDAAGTVYWANRCSGQLLELPRGAAYPNEILTGLNGPYGVGVDAAGNVYFDEYFRGTLSRLAPGSSTPQTLLTGLTYPNYMSVDSAGDVYFITGQTCGDKIVRYDASSHVLTTILAAPQPHDSNHGFGGLFIDHFGNLYYTTCDYLTVNLLPSGSTSPSTVLNTPSRPSGVAVDSLGNVYYTLYNSSVDELAAGSATPMIITTRGSSRLQLAIDQYGDLYFTDDVGGRIWELSVQSATVSTTATVTSTLVTTSVVPPSTVTITSLSSSTQTVSVFITPSATIVTSLASRTSLNQPRTQTLTTSLITTSTIPVRETTTQTIILVQSATTRPWSSTAIIALILIISIFVAYVLLSARRKAKPSILPSISPSPIDQTAVETVDGIIMKYLSDHGGKISISTACADLGIREPQLRDSLKRLVEKGLVS